MIVSLVALAEKSQQAMEAQHQRKQESIRETQESIRKTQAGLEELRRIGFRHVTDPEAHDGA
jgi:hypothetical protein